MASPRCASDCGFSNSMVERKLCCKLGRRIDLGTGQYSWSRKTAQCSDDAGVAVAIGRDYLDLLEKHLESLGLKDWMDLECWAGESYSEAVAGSTLFVCL